MPWGLIVTGLVGALGWAFGLWQLARAGSFQKDVRAQSKRADDGEAQLAAVTAQAKTDAARFERLVASLKSEIEELESTNVASLPAGTVRTRLERLLSPATAPTAPAAGVPARPAT